MKNSQKKHIGKSLIIASWVLRFSLFLVAFFTQKVAILIVIAALSVILLLCSIKYRNDFDITKEAFLTKEIIINHIRLQTKKEEPNTMKFYEEPILEISEVKASDIVTISLGDSEYDDQEW